MTRDELESRHFVTPTEVAHELDGADPRTVRAAIKRGEIPSVRLGTRILVPATWLRNQLGEPAHGPEPAMDLDQLADRVADRVIARLARTFGGMASDVTTAGPAPPGPAATACDLLPAKEQSRVHRTPAA